MNPKLRLTSLISAELALLPKEESQTVCQECNKFITGNMRSANIRNAICASCQTNFEKDSNQINNKSMKYYSIVFMQGEEANEAFDILDSEGNEALLDYLKQWDFAGESENRLTESDKEPWGKSDKLITIGKYTISYNKNLGYVSLTRCEKF